MWMPSDHGGIEDRCRKDIVDVLWQQRQDFRDFLSANGVEAFAIQKHPPFAAAAKPGQGVHGEGFAAAVLPQDGEHFTGGDVELQRVDERPPGDRNADIPTGK